MKKSDLISFAKSDSIKNFIQASEVKTKSDISDLQQKQYLIGFTFDELKEIFPEKFVNNLCYNNGINKSYYYDKEVNVLFPVQLYGEATLKPYDELAEEALQRADELELEMKNGNFTPTLLVLNDKMRMEMFNLLLEKNAIEQPYALFLSFYQTSDYGCSELTEESIKKIYKSKTEEQKEQTNKSLINFPDKVVVYRGEGDKSAAWDKSVSWTTDINVANFFASRMDGRKGIIHIAEVDKENIIEFFRMESECIILPENITIKDQIQIKGMDYLEKKLPEIIGDYYDYRYLITDFVEYKMDEEHGDLHSARVLLNCLLIANDMKLTMHETDILAITAVFHDAMRENDGKDISHGEASAEYYKKFCENRLGLVNYEKVVEQIIRYHCQPDETGRENINKRYLKLYDIFKDADALDRVRFGIRDLDINQLRTPEAKTMTMVADIIRQGLRLFDQSEEQCETETMELGM